MGAAIHGTAVEAPERLSDPLSQIEVTELFVRYLDR